MSASRRDPPRNPRRSREMIGSLIPEERPKLGAPSFKGRARRTDLADRLIERELAMDLEREHAEHDAELAPIPNHLSDKLHELSSFPMIDARTRGASAIGNEPIEDGVFVVGIGRGKLALEDETISPDLASHLERSSMNATPDVPAKTIRPQRVVEFPDGSRKQFHAAVLGEILGINAAHISRDLWRDLPREIAGPRVNIIVIVSHRELLEKQGGE